MLAALERGLRDHHGAHDLAQDVWLKVYRALGSFRPGAAFRPWLFAIVFNRLRDEQRRRGSEPERPVQVPRSEATARLWRAAPFSDGTSERVDETDAIDAALAAVPEPYRAAVHLVDVLGFDHGEAAIALDCEVGTVKSRVHRGRLAFREHYERLCRPRRALGVRAESGGTHR